MSDMTATGAPGLTTADGRPLKAALKRAQARAKRRAFLLVLPLLAFIVLTFILPIGQLLHESIYNPDFHDNMPKTVAWFQTHPQGTQPDEAAYAALAADLTTAAAARTVAQVGTRVNYAMPGTRSLFSSIGRKAKDLTPPFKDALIAADPQWGSADLWATMRNVSHSYTADFYLAAVDHTHDVNGNIVPVSSDQAIYVLLFERTFLLAGLITLICFVIGYPVAHLLAVLPLRSSNLLMILVLLPFWTSLLVRTTSWIALLQREGVINDLMVWLGLIDNHQRLQMIYNQAGTVVAMTHILLPFMILPLYSVMRPIPPSYARAARSLGATSWTTFRRIYFPQTLPGIGAGSMLVFILAVGYYITPALVGGASGQLISNQVAYFITGAGNNWSLGCAIAGILLAAILLLYWLYDRLVGIDNMKLG
ncbi:spermidine/putrescine transport system permease protein PotB [mine drainage metagenome]|uniref:Spermidine/putrescine transport system permease protein PotB n=1 Tax=mine drainage metagenome TaxID=410659 RepID=A0A1J5PVB4_9ZZZZ